MDKKGFSLNQLDLLKEISTVGSANAATALADLIGMKVEIGVPEVSIVRLKDIADILGRPETLYTILDLEIKGDITGRIFLLFSLDGAKRLSSTLLGKSEQELDFSTDMMQSALKESANILCGSYIAALAGMTNLNILTSVPSLAIDTVGAILDFIVIQIVQNSEEALIIKTNLNVSSSKLNGLLLLFLSIESLKKIFLILGIQE